MAVPQEDDSLIDRPDAALGGGRPGDDRGPGRVVVEPVVPETLSATRDLDGRLELFASGEGRVDRKAQSAPNVWQDWESFGPGTSGSGSGANADGRIEIIAGTSASPPLA
ncbi:hypothetical protein [Streptomyces luteoverticillatus]|uniref:hypothetical protein n=1 Tax=Streptomyces luteoverticillatus TaxID=66425 RepID=UPI001F0C0DDB|nr:hypothetical protein [Streptomyces luteoverticillatus]